MPPKAAATSGKDNSTKRVKDLEFLLTCLKTFPNVVQVDYEELSKELVKQGDNINIAAARNRVSRMGRALDITTKAVTGAAPKTEAQPKPKPVPKKKATTKKKSTKSGDDDENDESSSKKKLEDNADSAKDEEEEGEEEEEEE